jgi:DNA-binding XRE family transcriptional regulator
MAREESDKLLAELRAWADQAKYGAQKKLADSLGVAPQTLNHWITGRKYPNLNDGLKLQAFLKTWRGLK